MIAGGTWQFNLNDIQTKLLNNQTWATGPASTQPDN
jgi:hypothetical protein